MANFQMTYNKSDTVISFNLKKNEFGKSFLNFFLHLLLVNDYDVSNMKSCTHLEDADIKYYTITFTSHFVCFNMFTITFMLMCCEFDFQAPIISFTMYIYRHCVF